MKLHRLERQPAVLARIEQHASELVQCLPCNQQVQGFVRAALAVPQLRRTIGGSELRLHRVQLHGMNDEEDIVLQKHMLATAVGAAQGALLAEETG